MRLRPHQRRDATRLQQAGLTLREIATRLGVSYELVCLALYGDVVAWTPPEAPLAFPAAATGGRDITGAAGRRPSAPVYEGGASRRIPPAHLPDGASGKVGGVASACSAFAAGSEIPERRELDENAIANGVTGGESAAIASLAKAGAPASRASESGDRQLRPEAGITDGGQHGGRNLSAAAADHASLSVPQAAPHPDPLPCRGAGAPAAAPVPSLAAVVPAPLVAPVPSPLRGEGQGEGLPRAEAHGAEPKFRLRNELGEYLHRSGSGMGAIEKAWSGTAEQLAEARRRKPHLMQLDIEEVAP